MELQAEQEARSRGSSGGRSSTGTASPETRRIHGRQPRVLYLSFFFPPSRASGVFRGLATANHLARAGWETTVLTAPRVFFSRYLGGAVDETLDAAVDPRLRVVRPAMGYYQWEKDIRSFGRLRTNYPTLLNALYQRTQTRVFPEHYLSWAPPALATAIKMHARRRFDLVVATGNPFVSFAMAWLLGRCLRRPYVVDYRDAWTFNQFTEEVRFPPGSPAAKWERRVLRDAAEAVFVNDGMRQWHAEHYPFAADRMAVVPNGWEPEILDRLAYRPPDPSRPLRFGYMGTITPYLPLDVLFDGWRKARSHPLLAEAQLDFHGHLGFFPHQAESVRRLLPLDDGLGVSYRGPFGKAGAASVYDQTDALVFCVPGARYVTSGKVFEYMACGKPIISVHSPEIAAAEILRGYPRWFAGARLDADSVAQSLVAAATAAREPDRAAYDAAAAYARGYTREATLSPWESRMFATVAGKGRR